jgi:serine/threonine protein kinase
MSSSQTITQRKPVTIVTSSEDRRFRKELEIKQRYSLLKSHGFDLRDLAQHCEKAYKEKVSAVVNPQPDKNSKKNAYEIFHEKEVCKLFIQDEKIYYDTTFGKFIFFIENIFKHLFGSPTGKDLIKNTEGMIDQIENCKPLKYCLDINYKPLVETKPFKKYIESLDDLISALNLMPGKFKISDSTENNEIINSIEFPVNSSMQLTQSTMIPLTNILTTLTDLKKDTLVIKHDNAMLFKSRDNHWYFFTSDMNFFIDRGSAKDFFVGYDLSMGKEVAIAVTKNSSNVELKAISNEIQNEETKTNSNKRIKNEEYQFFKGAMYEDENLAQLQDLFIFTSTTDGIKRKTCYLVSEKSDSSLPKFLAKRRMETPKQKAKQNIQIASGIIRSVFQIHKKENIHRDLKTDNILVSRIDGKLKVSTCDMELMCNKNDLSNAKCFHGSPEYFSPEEAMRFLKAKPEYITGIEKLLSKKPEKKQFLEKMRKAEVAERATQKWDIWSSGLILYRTCFGEDLLQETTEKAWKDLGLKRQITDSSEFARILNCSYAILNLDQDYINEKIEKQMKANPDLDPRIKDILLSMLSINSKQRSDIDSIQERMNLIDPPEERPAVNDPNGPMDKGKEREESH